MKSNPSSRTFAANPLLRLLAGAGLALTTASTMPLWATPIPQNLGNGLRTIVEQQSAPTQPSQARAGSSQPQIIGYDELAMKDEQNRVLVNVMLNGKVTLARLQERIAALGGNKITANSVKYRAGVIEMFVAPAQAVRIAKMEGVSAVNLVPKPLTNVGKATTQGIVQHRINKLPSDINGSGITVGVLSDSYNTNFSEPIRAREDVASGDLPGPGNPFGRTKRVIVFEEDSFGTDEGRAMLQIVHDIAPEARLGFATAFSGEVGFADNIRSLAGLPSGSRSKPNFKADVIVDDVIYFDEPMFQDGIVAQAVDDVAAAGVSYFSSAGNRPASQAYAAPFRLVKNAAAATVGTNLDFSNVDPSLFKGGFHDFAAGGPQDIAQTIHVDGSAIISFQWNEPYDATPPALGRVLQSGSGTLTDAMPTETFTFEGTAGQQIGIVADADPASSNPLPDVTIQLIDPQGNEVAFQDATTNPETLLSFLPVTGTYKIVIGGFEGATGDFVYEVRQGSGTKRVQTDFNLLIFDTAGRFLGAIAENNLATNRPIELAGLSGTFDFQLVIARANTPPRGVLRADQLRYVFFRGGLPMEHLSYRDPGTFGHNCAAGASGVAAYAFFPPFIPESFTSPGPVTIYFDRNNNPLPRPDRRQKPDMAAMDGANTTFFVSDASQDRDQLPNFFGTSAAAPHAAGIAALMLQAAGGPSSLSPDSLRSTLQKTAFLHDLDPSYSAGVAQNGADTVVYSAEGDGSNTSSADPNFFQLTYAGSGSVKRVELNLSQANPTETPNQGLVLDPRDGVGLPFTLGNLTGVPPAAVTADLQQPTGAGQFSQLTLSLSPGVVTAGDVIRFGIDRDEADAFGPNGAVGGNSADLLGEGVLIPEGTLAPGGASFSARLESGKVLRGTFTNTIGHGYSRLDGFGFVNAQDAVNLVKKP